MRRLLACAAFATIGCGSGRTVDVGGGGSPPAAFPAPPQVQYFGGPVLAHPKPVAVFFAQDESNASSTAFVSAMTEFTRTVTASAYFTSTVAEYGVGVGSVGSVVELAETAPATIDDGAIKTWLADEIASGSLPSPDPDTMYVLYYPVGASITLDGASSCVAFAGYHDSAGLANGSQVAYAVIPRCDPTVDTATSAASHEIAEAATDPYPHSSPAYAQVDLADYVWQTTLGGGEIGDLCAPLPVAFATFPPFPYRVQRLWSNKAAREGRDPCQPELPGEVYVGAAPVLPDMSSISVDGQPVSVRSVKIPVGQRRAIPVDLFSQGPTAPFTIEAVDLGPAVGAGKLLELTLSATTGVNGDVPTLDIEVLKAGTGNAELFFVSARGPSSDARDAGSPAGIWLGLVTH